MEGSLLPYCHKTHKLLKDLQGIKSDLIKRLQDSTPIMIISHQSLIVILTSSQGKKNPKSSAHHNIMYVVYAAIHSLYSIQFKSIRSLSQHQI
jgi:hypothetical protein